MPTEPAEPEAERIAKAMAAAVGTRRLWRVRLGARRVEQVSELARDVAAILPDSWLVMVRDPRGRAHVHGLIVAEDPRADLERAVMRRGALWVGQHVELISQRARGQSLVNLVTYDLALGRHDEKRSRETPSEILGGGRLREAVELAQATLAPGTLCACGCGLSLRPGQRGTYLDPTHAATARQRRRRAQADEASEPTAPTMAPAELPGRWLGELRELAERHRSEWERMIGRLAAAERGITLTPATSQSTVAGKGKHHHARSAAD